MENTDSLNELPVEQQPEELNPPSGESEVVIPPPLEFVSEAEEYTEILNKVLPDSPMALQLEKSKEFLQVCASCPKLLPTFKMCIEDGSYVEASSKVPGRACPLGKWIY